MCVVGGLRIEPYLISYPFFWVLFALCLGALFTLFLLLLLQSSVNVECKILLSNTYYHGSR